jgi:hypothetical protein
MTERTDAMRNIVADMLLAAELMGPELADTVAREMRDALFPIAQRWLVRAQVEQARERAEQGYEL